MNDSSHSGVSAYNVGTKSAENLAEELGNRLLNSNQHLRDTVDTVGAARINIELVDNIEMPAGKPQRLVDTR